ncbi:hypothetical protein BT63DRAFT_477968 [Microthyrium microscopicum]|uniref:Uncharacterized protein n=1 Tax=Microthyrium microscopicum TaxID=703497 RepID=A0A6A6UJ39_9PEZI|nr:hypothetical protein BT63DRAFT_477968 [Microthyrium microscopicum]
MWVLLLCVVQILAESTYNNQTSNANSASNRQVSTVTGPFEKIDHPDPPEFSWEDFVKKHSAEEAESKKRAPPRTRYPDNSPTETWTYHMQLPPEATNYITITSTITTKSIGPSITAFAERTTANDNGNSCVQSWKLYYQSHVHYTLSSRMRADLINYGVTPDYRSFADYKLASSTLMSPYVSIKQTSSAYVKPMPKQCDGLPRVTLLSEKIIPVTRLVSQERYYTRNDNNTRLPNKLWYLEPKERSPNQPGDPPHCLIETSQCAAQWGSFKAFMRAWKLDSAEYTEYFRYSWEKTSEISKSLWPPFGFNITMADVENIMKVPNEVTWTGDYDGDRMAMEILNPLGSFQFGRCPEPVDDMRLWYNWMLTMPVEREKTSNISRDELLHGTPAQAAKIMRRAFGCAMEADVAVLHYFGQSQLNATARNLCENDGAGTARDRNSTTSVVRSMIRTVNKITFPEYTILGHLGETVTALPKSVITGAWTVTSPSVLVAIQAVTLHHEFQWPRPILSRDIVLQVKPEDVRTYVVQDSIISLRSLHFADLNGPVPASAYMGAVSLDYRNAAKNYDLDPDTTVTDGSYFPWIALPTRITEAFPELTDCNFKIDDPMSDDWHRYPAIKDPPLDIIASRLDDDGKMLSEFNGSPPTPGAAPTPKHAPDTLNNNFVQGQKTANAAMPSLGPMPAGFPDSGLQDPGPRAQDQQHKQDKNNELGEKGAPFEGPMALDGLTITPKPAENKADGSFEVVGQSFMFRLRPGDTAVVASQTFSMNQEGILYKGASSIAALSTAVRKLSPPQSFSVGDMTLVRINDHDPNDRLGANDSPGAKGSYYKVIISSSTAQLTPGLNAITMGSRTVSLNNHGVVFDAGRPITTVPIETAGGPEEFDNDIPVNEMPRGEALKSPKKKSDAYKTTMPGLFNVVAFMIFFVLRVWSI